MCAMEIVRSLFFKGPLSWIGHGMHGGKLGREGWRERGLLWTPCRNILPFHFLVFLSTIVASRPPSLSASVLRCQCAHFHTPSISLLFLVRIQHGIGPLKVRHQAGETGTGRNAFLGTQDFEIWGAFPESVH